MRLAHLICVLTAILASGLHSANAEEHQELRELIAVALKQNPQLDAIAAQVEALEQKTTQAGAWKDPILTVAYQNVPVDSFALGQEGMSMLRIQLGQTIPLIGKTGKREGVVRQAEEAKRWEHEEKKNQLRAAVKQVYYKIALTRQLKKLTGDHVELVDQLLDAVRIKYEVGRAPQENLLRLEVLRDRLRDDLKDFDRRDRELTAALNAALHRDHGTHVSTPPALEVSAMTSDIAGLQERALEHRPALKRLDSNIEMHRVAAELARYEARPDPTLFAAYGVRTALPNGNPGRDLVTFGLSVPLPVFYRSRYDARAEESASLARASLSQRDALIDTIASGLADAVATWSRSADKVATYKENLVPASRRTLDATLSSYQVDRADFLSLFEAELELLNFEKTIRVATVDALVAQAAVEMLTGKEL